MKSSLCLLWLLAAAAVVDGQGPPPVPPAPPAPGNPIPLRPLSNVTGLTVNPNEIKMHNPALNPSQWAFLQDDGKMKAFQYFLKKYNTKLQFVDVERYLEILAYAHEYLEWGPQGPPGGFSIQGGHYSLPRVRPARKKREIGEEQMMEKTLEGLLKEAKVAEDLKGEQREQTIEGMSRTLVDLMRKGNLKEGMKEVAKGMKDMEEETRQKRHTHGQLVTLFDTEAEKKYKRFVERKEVQTGPGEDEGETGNPASQKDTRPYVKAVGTYVLVPKNTDLDQLQREFRRAVKEQRQKRDMVEKLRSVAKKTHKAL